MKNFPDINFTWDEPHTIMNAIIDSDNNSNHNFFQILTELDKLLCKNIQLRFYEKIELEYLGKIIKQLNDIISVDIIMNSSFGDNILKIYKTMITTH